ncbi:MAG: hypothetical protein CMG29_04275 [Candidatus Marinimicrobia bacterium]|jgi:hypothetical protein|nr:hypothetical protein [Candidatus Neomarinimicrobiota bacterium]|tara:strand:+ start:3932 stop:4723 length:792 start_codon:yes stop_codon:yes gene_type:complete
MMKSMKIIRNKLFLVIALILLGCSGENWRDPLGISSSGDGSKLNPDGTPYVPAPGHLSLSITSLDDIPVIAGSGPFSVSLILKNTGTEPLTIKEINSSESWMSVDGVVSGQEIKGIDTIETWVTFIAGYSDDASISFVWNSLDNPDSTESFSVSLDVGDESTWDIVYNEIFDKTCSCHFTSSGAGELKMSNQELAYDNIVDIAAYEVPELKRIDPGYPDRSYLVKKLVGVDIEGDRMPRDGPPFLSDRRIEQVRLWVQIGAPE